MPPPRLDRDAYTVGWITILPVEFVAARAMLDVGHERPTIPSDDPYLYANGSIAGHNVVIVCSGEAGVTPANHCATQMKRTFPNIKIGFLSGIGGGVPSPRHDIRLGDVVVSRPGQAYGGVACYDPGQLTDDGLVPTGHLDRPPLVLRNAVAWLEADLVLDNAQFLNSLASIRPTHLIATDNLVDVLYEAGDIAKEVEREPRSTGPGPRIHYGLIASGSWVIKTSGSKRDDLLWKIKGDVLCFEMEAAGLMNTFPCLVVRGISDYCDSHKNDGWHQYASTTAACYCKLLLKLINVEDVKGASSVATVTNEMNEHLENPNKRRKMASGLPGQPLPDQRASLVEQAKYCFDPSMAISEDELQQCIQQLQYTPAEDELDHMKHQKGPIVTDSCSWISSEVNDFLRSPSPVIWIHGDPGKGKTMMSIYLIQYLRDKKGSGSVYFFFCQHDSDEHKSAGAILKSLICQILLDPELAKWKRLSLGRHLSETCRMQGARLLNSRASEESLRRTLHNILAELDNAIIMVDGLDECEVRSVSSLTEHMIPVTMNASIKYILTSRNQPKILRQNLKDFTEVHLEQAQYDSQIRRGVKGFLRAKFDELESNSVLSSSIHQRSRERDSLSSFRAIKKQLSEMADDSFIWAAMLYDQIRNEGLEYAVEFLKDCPVDLGTLYKRIIRRVLMLDPNALLSSGRNKRLDGLRATLCRRILRTLCVAPRSLTKLEMQRAIDFENSGAEFPFEGILEDCGGLIVLRDDQIHFVHLSLKNYILEEDSQEEFDLSIADGHAELATNCMKFLESMNATTVGPRVGDTDSEAPSAVFIDGKQNSDSLFMDYATSYCMLHATEALKHSEVSAPILKRLEAFFNSSGGCLFYSRWAKSIPGSLDHHSDSGKTRLNQRELLIVAARFGLREFLDLEDPEYPYDQGFRRLLIETAATHDHCQVVSAIIERLKLHLLNTAGVDDANIAATELKDLAADTSLVHGSIATWTYAWSRETSHAQTLFKAVLEGHAEILRIILRHGFPETYEEMFLPSIWWGPFTNHRDESRSALSLNTAESPEPGIKSNLRLYGHFDELAYHYSDYYNYRLKNHVWQENAIFQLRQSAPLASQRSLHSNFAYDRVGYLRLTQTHSESNSTVELLDDGGSSSEEVLLAIYGTAESSSSIGEVVLGSTLEDVKSISSAYFDGHPIDCRIMWKIGNLLDIAIEKSRTDITKVLLESEFPIESQLARVVDISLHHGWGKILERLIGITSKKPDEDLSLGNMLYLASCLGQYECIDVILAAGGSGDMPTTGKRAFDLFHKTGKEISVMCRLAQEANHIAIHYLINRSPITRSRQCFNKAFIPVLKELDTEGSGSSDNIINDDRITKERVRMCFYFLSEHFGDLPPGWQQHKTASGWYYFSKQTDCGYTSTWQDPRIPYEIGESLDDLWSHLRAPRYDLDFERYLEENYGLDTGSPTLYNDDINGDTESDTSATVS